MKRFLIVFLIVSISPVFADENKINCGKTIEDCQKLIDSDIAKVNELNIALQGAITQRDQIQKQYNDSQLQNFIITQKAAQAAEKKVIDGVKKGK